MEILKVHYLAPYNTPRVSYFRDLSAVCSNFGSTLRDLQRNLEVAHNITKEEFDNNIIKYVNEYSLRIRIEVIKID